MLFCVMENYKITIFDSVDDPRVEGRCLHKLSDILFIACCTLISNGEDCIDMEEYGCANQEWLYNYLELPNGIPTHDTFNRVLQKLSPKSLEEVLYSQGIDLVRQIAEKHIIIDGKKIKGASPKSRGNKGLYILNAWVSGQNLCIGQKRIEDKTNEIKEIPNLLQKIDIQSSIVSIDAIGCQKKISEQIKGQGADYILSVKDNQKNLHEELQEIFKYAKIEEQAIEYEKDHGRVESRECLVMKAKNHLSPLLIQDWPTIEQIIHVKSVRIIKNVESKSSRYYISSAANKTAKEFNKLIRSHWSIENQLHWHLDVTFNEDDCRHRTGHAPENLNILRKLALAKIRTQSDKKSLKKRRYRASLDKNYLAQLLLN